jgi:hypothetical protein
MTTPALERWLLTPAPDPRDAHIAALAEERDALLYACRVALAYLEDVATIRGFTMPGQAKTCESLREAIAKAEGGAVGE